MKKILVIIIILTLISPTALAFSINDILTNFREKLSGITGHDTVMFDLCTEGTTRCGESNECGGAPCTMLCQNDQWIEWGYCAEQCENGICTTPDEEVNTTTFDPGDTFQATCSDGTLYNQCSSNKPNFCDNGNLIQDCNTCECQSGYNCRENRCIEEVSGGENDDPNILNLLPIVFPIPLKIIKIDENLQFEIRAVDPNEDILSFYFNNQQDKITTERVECLIQENIVNCKAIKDGETKLKIIVSDQIGEVETEVTIKVIKELPEFQKGIAAGVANTPPVADAGSDITGTPGVQIILDASLSYDQEGLPSIPQTYQWHENNQIIATGKTVEELFSPGKHSITLEVTDTEGLTNTDTITVTIEPRTSCRNTNVKYYPKDTSCNNKWPVKDGPEFKINSLTEGACSLFDVCDESTDPIIEESIKCCNEGLTDPEKATACNFAKETQDTFKNCQARYIIKSLGRPIYMKGYFDAEMCCKGVGVLCPKSGYLYTANPLPSHLKNKGLQCPNTPDNNPNGVWKSDTKLELNNIALSDVHASASLNILKTGTCVDYSVAATTLIRKIGFSVNKIFTIEASDHAFNLIQLETNNKFTIFDMTGNNDGYEPGEVPKGYNYCENILNCYNDVGKVSCPSNENIYGCENIKEKTGRVAERQVEGVKGTLQGFWEKLWGEITR